MSILAKQMKKSSPHFFFGIFNFYPKGENLLKKKSYNPSLVPMGFEEDEDNEEDMEFEDFEEFEEEESWA